MKRKTTKTSSSRTRQPSPRAKSATRPKRQAAPSPADLLEDIRRNILFTGVRAKTIQAVLPGVEVRLFDAGDVIFDEFTTGRAIYMIVRGRVRIKKYAKYGVESMLAVLRQGDFFGELSIIDNLPRSARAEALTGCTIAVLQGEQFRTLVHESEAFAMNLLKKLSLSLRSMDQTFVAELERNALESHQKMERLNLLIEASKTVNSAIEIDRLLGLILMAAARSINADRGTLYLVDEERQELWSKAAQGPVMVEIRLPMGRGLAGYVAKTGETVNIADAYQDPRFNPEIDRKSGYRTHNVLCMPMRDRGGRIVGVFQLLNKRKGSFTADDEAFIDALSVHAALAIENARMAQEMVRTERLSAVGRMASTIIHDIKNPMGTLRMYAQVIKKNAANEEGVRMADEMIRQVDRFVTMTQEILDFSRGISEINLQTVDMDQVMEGGMRFVEQDLSRRSVTLERAFAYHGPVLMDLDKMVRVFYNLATNAADAMPKGGTLRVATRERDGHVEIAFTDSGAGIPEEIRARIFEPFFTHGKAHGTGLGLSIVKKIMDDHRGAIEVESAPGAGTTFRLLLPLPR